MTSWKVAKAVGTEQVRERQKGLVDPRVGVSRTAGRCRT